jgi:carboxyl-terminal processing protease
MRRLFILSIFIPLFVSSVLAQQMNGVDRDRMRGMLKATSGDIAKYFYDPEMKGLDWKTLTAEADEKIKQAKTTSEAITAIAVLVDKLKDSHTQFVPPSRAGRPVYGFSAKMFGDEARIYQVKPGSNADKAGLQPGDHILQIFNYRPQRKNFDDAMYYYRVLHPMPELKITYQRGSEATQTVSVPAKVKTSSRSVEIEDIYHLMMDTDEDERYFYGSFDGDIGYLQLPSFGAERIPIPDIAAPHAFVLDLRGNPGGRVDSLGDFAGHFTSKAGILNNMHYRKKTEPVKIKPHGDRFNVPLIILVDSRSASAAEIFARYFQKTGQAKVVGDTSSGQVNTSLYYPEEVGGSSVVPFGVQIAIARVAFEDGEELEHHPIIPDYPCLPTEADLHSHADPCLKKAVALARKAAGRTEELTEKVAAQVERAIAQRNEYIAEQLKRPD